MNLIYKKAAAFVLALSVVMTFTVSVTASTQKTTTSTTVAKNVNSSTSNTSSTTAKSSSDPTSNNSSQTTGTGSTTVKTDTSKETTATTSAADDENPTLEIPSINAGSAIVMDCDTGAVLYGLNENTQMPMASTTKIMTCILALESGDIGRTVTVNEDYYQPALEGSTLIGLKPGYKITMYDLCVAMMMYSGNDAANAAAVEVGGSIDNFVSMMNEKACELGMLNTHFDTPSGLDQDSDGAHYSTAYDMALLGRYAMKNPDFADIVNFKARSIYYDEFPRGRTLITHNYLLEGQAYGYDGCDGIKTGVTNLAGQCLVSHVTSDEGLSLICVSLNNNNRWQDHRKLYNYAKSLYTQVAVDPDISDFDSVIVGGVKKTVSVECQPDETFNVLKTQKENVKKQIVCDKFLYAPVEEGDVVGYLQYVADGSVVASYPITATENIEATTGGWFSEYIQAIQFSSENNS